MTANAVNTYIVPTVDNEVTMPNQPCFLGVLSGADVNVTGAGATYTIGTTVAFTEIYDQNSDFNVNGTFTAPVTGRHLLCFHVDVINITAAMTRGYQRLVTSNRTYSSFSLNVAAGRNTGTDGISWGGAVVADMDLGDTATNDITIQIGAGDTADLATPGTFFSGALLC